jgi:uncharacterized membrane protein (UPF0127 family)
MKLFFRPIILLGLSLCMTACKTESSKQAEIVIQFNKEGTASLFKTHTDTAYTKFDVEFAKTEYETQTGLMYRNSMENHQGMLFIFDDSEPRYFYMKNTRIPLDIIYLSKDKEIVTIHKEAQPFNENSLPSNGPAQYVLEINGGLVDRLGIEMGDRLEFQNLE